MAKKAWLRFLLPGVLILIVGVGLLVKFGIERAAAEEVLAKFPDRGVPRMNITLNGVTLEEINAGSKDVKYEGNEVTVYEGDSATLEASGVRVKGRGNGTWVQKKKPYQIKFDKKVDLFGMGKAKKWVLLANAADMTNLRNSTALYLGKMLGMNYMTNGTFMELYVNGNYVGLYYLTHMMEIGKNEINMRDEMGVLMELDNVYGGKEKYYLTKNGDKLVVKDTVRGNNENLVAQVFLQKYNSFEAAVDRKDYGALSEVIDVDSFAKYYLLSEYTMNPDAYWTSFYMYMDGIADVIHAGPGWDFDAAFGNKKWARWLGDRLYSPRETMVRKNEILTEEEYSLMGMKDEYLESLKLSRIIFKLMEIPGFQERVSSLYKETLKGRQEELLQKMKNDAGTIKKAAEENEQKWSKDNESMEDQLNNLTEWMIERYKYFDEIYGSEIIDGCVFDKNTKRCAILEKGET